MTFSAPPRDWRAWPAWFRDTAGAGRLPLRAFLGVTFVFAALQKLANPAFFRSSNPAGIEAQMRSAQSFSPIGGLLVPAIHVAGLLGYVIAFGELAVGIGTLLGLRARIAAAGGMFLSLMFFLTVSWSTTPYYYGADIVFLFAWTPFLISGPGDFSLDAWLASRPRSEARPLGEAAAAGGAPADVDRRAAISRFGLTGVTGVVVLVFGGIVAFVGRAFASSSNDATSGLGTLPGAGSGTTGTTTGGPRGGSGPSGGATTTTAGTTKPKGTKIGFVTDVPVGQAAPFTLQSVPAYVVRPKADEFLGFSRICTHEGCTVNYVHSVQQFQCPCHGSVYSALTGDVLGGPAPSPLPKIPIAEGPGGQLFAG